MASSRIMRIDGPRARGLSQTVSIRAPNRDPARLAEPNEVFRQRTAFRTPRSAALFVGSTPSTRANVCAASQRTQAASAENSGARPWTRRPQLPVTPSPFALAVAPAVAARRLATGGHPGPTARPSRGSPTGGCDAGTCRQRSGEQHTGDHSDLPVTT